MFEISKSLIDDRRGAPRSKVSLSAYLIMQSGISLRGTTINLSRSGAFVKTDASLKWQVGETAKLILALSEGNMVRLARYSVLVVRGTQTGLGLAFWRSPRPSLVQRE
jgi:hypothetical protein